MTSVRRRQTQAFLVLVLGALALLTGRPESLAATSGEPECGAQYNCWDTCSTALFEANCSPPQEPVCLWRPLDCPFECQFKSACDEI